MKKIHSPFILGSLLSLFSYFSILSPLHAAPPRGAPGDNWADRILGQFDFSEIKFNEATAQTLFHPTSVFVDRAHGPGNDILYVFDSGNNRILGVHSVTSAINGQGADLVLGQPDFKSTGSNHDSNWQVYSWQNALSGLPQGVVSPTADSICGIGYQMQSPAEASVGGNMAGDSLGNLYVTDYANNRILRFDTPISSGQAADHVWGHLLNGAENFNSGFQNDSEGAILGALPGVPSDHSLNFMNTPSNSAVAGCAIDAWGNLWVADECNNRVLRFPNSTPGVAGGVPSMTADVALGQADLHSRVWATSVADTMHLSYPTGVRVDTRGNVYVTEAGMGRIAIFQPSGYNGTGVPQYTWQPMKRAVTAALGISTLTTVYGLEFDPLMTNPNAVGFWVTAAITANTPNYFFQAMEYQANFTNPNTLGTVSVIKNFAYQGSGAPGIDSAGDLYLGNPNGEKVTRYRPNIATPTPGINIFEPAVGAGNPPSPNKITAVGLLQGNSVCVASAPGSGVTQVIAADGVRIHFWNMPSGPLGLTNGQPESGYAGVASPYICNNLGFSELYAWNDIPNNKGYLCALEFLPTYNRVDIFSLPLSTGPSATPLVILNSHIPVLGGGYVDWTAPQGLMADLAGNLWLSDTQHNRVVRIRNPLGVSPGPTPVVDIILGQPNVASTTCNGSGTDMVGGVINPCTDIIPSATSLNAPGALGVDHHGDIYVSDHCLEDQGNLRLLRWNASAIPANPPSCVFAIPANGVYGVNATSPTSNEFTEYRDNTKLGDSGYWHFSFNSNDSIMVAGTDSQTSGGLPPVIIQNPRGVDALGTPIPNNPLAGDNVIGHLEDFGPQSYGVAFDGDDNLYVSELNRSRVMVYLQPFAVTTTTVTPTPTATPGCFQAIGMIPLPPGGFGQPQGIATDRINNRLYVTDALKNLVFIYNDPPGGSPTYLTSVGGLTNPNQVSVDNEGNFFVGQAGGWVKKFSPSGTLLATIITPSNINGVYVDGNGILYTSSNFQNKVTVFKQTCPNTYSQVAQFNGSGAVTFHTPGSLWKVGNVIYVADTSNNRIVSVTETVTGGVYTYGPYAVVNISSSGSLLLGPSAITSDLAGNFYVDSYANCCLLGFSSGFVFNHFLQTGLACYPNGVAVDAAGNIFESGSGGNVAEIRNCAIQPTMTPVILVTPTWSCTLPPTNTATVTRTNTATSTATSSPTGTLTYTPTATPTSTASNTASSTSTNTATLTSTNSSTATSTSTATPSPTNSVTSTPTDSPTGTLSDTATSTMTSTPTMTYTGTATSTSTLTGTSTPTNTRTFTPTATMTNSSTNTFVPTATKTATSSPTPVQTVILYPNPYYGPGKLNIHLAMGQTADVRIEIFTLAFRKVQEDVLLQHPAGQDIAIDLKDKWGNNLANGLYYLRVSTSLGHRSYVVKLIVLR